MVTENSSTTRPQLKHIISELKSMEDKFSLTRKRSYVFQLLSFLVIPFVYWMFPTVNGFIACTFIAVFAFIVVGITMSTHWSNIEKIKEYYIDNYVRPLLDIYEPSLEIKSRYLQYMMPLINSRFFNSDDYKFQLSISGNYQGVPINLFDVTEKKKSKKGGVIAIIKTNHELERFTKIYVTKDHTGDSYKAIDKALLRLKDSHFKSLEVIDLGSQEFNDSLNCFSNHQIESRLVLTPDVIQNICDLKRVAQVDIYLECCSPIIHSDKESNTAEAYVYLDFKRDLFEYIPWVTELNPESYQEDKETLGHIFEIYRLLSLNAIAKKE